jgi:hypothetical protein
MASAGHDCNCRVRRVDAGDAEIGARLDIVRIIAREASDEENTG